MRSTAAGRTETVLEGETTVSSYRLGDAEFRARRRAARMFLAFTFLLFGGAILVNEIQAQQMGAGSGFGDTHILPPAQAKAFFHDHPQSHP